MANAYEINDELLEFYVDFQLKNEILFVHSLQQLKGNFNWGRFQMFTQSVSHGAAPFTTLTEDEEAQSWLIGKLSTLWDARIENLLEEAREAQI